VSWGYFPTYDWVAFSWLFGSVDEQPFHYPQLCLDIKQWAIELGDPELRHQMGARHHALLDARWTRDAWAFLAALAPTAGERRATGRKNPDQFGAKLDRPIPRRSGSITERTHRVGHHPRADRLADLFAAPLPRHRLNRAAHALAGGTKKKPRQELLYIRVGPQGDQYDCQCAAI
jgi:hypothetical protein